MDPMNVILPQVSSSHCSRTFLALRKTPCWVLTYLLDLPDWVKGPFYCWYQGLSTCTEAHQVILETIKDEGPFDGVLGFSQGASLALSVMLHHEIHHPGEPPLFKFGIIFGANAVISPDPDFNMDKTAQYAKYYKKVMKKLGLRLAPEYDAIDENADSDDEDFKPGQANATFKKAAPKHRAFLLLPGQKEALIEELVSMMQELREYGGQASGRPEPGSTSWLPQEARPEDFPRFMHPLTVKQRVSVPTMHLICRGDSLGQQSEIALRLCDKKKTKVFCMNGGHRLPASAPDLRAVTSAMEWAMQKSNL